MKLAHYHRFPFYDYTRGASLFISISTEPRQRLFGEVIDAQMNLSPFGVEVLGAIEFTFSKDRRLRLFGHTVLPDHVHFRVYLSPGFSNDRAVVFLNQAVGRFKSYTTHLYQVKYGGHGVLWQEGYHDWLCLSREMIDSVERYIEYNVLKWWLRNGGGRLLMALHEPLESPRIGRNEYWRGVGAVGLLGTAPHGGGLLQGDGSVQGTGVLQGCGGDHNALAAIGETAAELREQPMVALRISRRCSAGEIAALVARLAAKADQFTVISGFISGGEREALKALLANPAAKIVKVSPYALPHDYAPPVSLMPAIAEGRLAIIARGNSLAEISRAACLDYNARIIDIADKAAYALPGELRWLK